MGSGMSLGRVSGVVVFSLVEALILVILALLVCGTEFLFEDRREKRLRVDMCPTCRYTLPAQGTQTCPECGGIFSEVDRRPSDRPAWNFRFRLFTACAIIALAWAVALSLTIAEYATTAYFGSRAFDRAHSLTYAPSTSDQWNDGWVIPDYRYARVAGGVVFVDSAVPDTDADIFRPTRWTPWLHLSDLFYDELGAEGRVFTYLD